MLVLPIVILLKTHHFKLKQALEIGFEIIVFQHCHRCFVLHGVLDELVKLGYFDPLVERDLSQLLHPIVVLLSQEKELLSLVHVFVEL